VIATFPLVDCLSAANDRTPQVSIVPLRESDADGSSGFADVVLPRIEGIPALSAVGILPAHGCLGGAR
jgi:hypothetical protein